MSFKVAEMRLRQALIPYLVGDSHRLWRRDRDARLLARHHEHEPPQADHRWHAPQTVRR